MQAVPGTAELLRTALATGDFTQVEHLLRTYTDEIAALLSDPNSLRDGEQAIREFHDLLSLARVMRAHISSQVSAIRREASYSAQASAGEEHAWRFVG